MIVILGTFLLTLYNDGGRRANNMGFNIEIECVLLGALITVITDVIWHYMESKNKKRHSARMLYYDILSIKKYVDQHNQNRLETYENLRYNREWQNILLELDFLSFKQVECVYNLYDTVYDFEYLDEYSWRYECFDKINKIITSKEFDDLMKKIQHKAKIRRG